MDRYCTSGEHGVCAALAYSVQRNCIQTVGSAAEPTICFIVVAASVWEESTVAASKWCVDHHQQKQQQVARSSGRSCHDCARKNVWTCMCVCFLVVSFVRANSSVQSIPYVASCSGHCRSSFPTNTRWRTIAAAALHLLLERAETVLPI